MSTSVRFKLSNHLLVAQARAVAAVGATTSFPADVEGLAAAARMAGITVLHWEASAIECEMAAAGFEQVFGFPVQPNTRYIGPCQVRKAGCELLNVLEVGQELVAP